jgi:amino acid transporter
MNQPVKSDVGNISAIAILLNMTFFGNNTYILLGVSLFLVIMAVYFFRKDKETLKLSPARITISLVLIVASVALGIYTLVTSRPVPLTP